MTDSPCTAVCTLDQNDVCLGCYRTADEIANWSQMNDDERKSVIDELTERAGD